MSVASGLSLAFVLIELRRQGAGGVRRRGRSRRLDEGGKEENLPGVYAREPYIWTGIRRIIRKGDDADQRVSQAPATGGRVLRTDDVVHRPSGWRFPGILPRSYGILHPCRRTGPRPNDLPTPT